MSIKLTLNVEKEVMERAKRYARKTGRSLSEIIESYLSSITEEHVKSELSPRLKKIVGAVVLPEDFDEKEALRSGMEKKDF